MSFRLWRRSLLFTPPTVRSPPLQQCSATWCRSHSTPTEQEVIPAEYAARRQRFLEHLPCHSIVLLPAADEVQYSHDILYPHRQDSLWLHLFGLPSPLRRQLDPPSSMLCEDVRATVAVFAKSRGGATHTLLCVPPVTQDSATLLWAAETTPPSVFRNLLRAGDVKGKEGEEVLSGSVFDSATAVTTNDVPTIRDAVCRLIARMAAHALAEEAQLVHRAADNDARAVSPSNTMLAAAKSHGHIEDQETRDRSALLSLMPAFSAAYPRQLRWDGRRYRLRQTGGEDIQPSARSNPKRRAAHTFHHPLEALFCSLDTTAFSLSLPRPLALSSKEARQPAWTSAVFRYKTAAAYTPGLVPVEGNSSAASVPESVVHIAPPLTQGTDSAALPVSSPKHAVQGAVRLPIRRIDPHAWLYRQLKCPSQLRQHLRSARATEDAFVHLMRSAAHTYSEHELHCTFQRQVCDCSGHCGPSPVAPVRSAYVPVIASGVRGTEIHYTDNNAIAASGDVVRVDAGLEIDGVPTDCTRTFPMGTSQFSAPQARLYDGLLRLQRTLLHRLAPGVAVGDVARWHVESTRALLCEVGVDVRRCSGHSKTPTVTPPNTNTKASSMLPDTQEQQVPLSLVRSCFCAHAFGHFFGLDIHEELSSLSISPDTEAPWKGKVVAVPTPHVFQGGMMHTVEPGVYLPGPSRAELFGLTAEHLPKAYRKGVGMQIEDDVLILPVAAPSSDAASNGTHCPWSRGTYLQHALGAFDKFYGGEGRLSHTAVADAPAFSPVTNTRRRASPSVMALLCHKHVMALMPTGRISSSSGPAAHEWNVLHFLFAQRVAMDGYANAVEAVAEDVRTVCSLCFAPSPLSAGGLPVPTAACTAWYPYAIVVLTATVPKDREVMELLLREPCGRVS